MGRVVIGICPNALGERWSNQGSGARSKKIYFVNFINKRIGITEKVLE